MKNALVVFAVLNLAVLSQLKGQLRYEGEEAQKVFSTQYKKIYPPDFLDEPPEYSVKELSAGVRLLEMSYWSDGFPGTRYGLINQSGDTLQPLFKGIVPWTDDTFLAYTQLTDENDEYLFWAFVLNANFDAIEVYQTSRTQFVAIRKDGKWGVVLKDDLKEVVPFMYDELGRPASRKITSDSSILAIPAKKEGKWGLVTQYGKRLTRANFDDMKFSSRDIYGTALLLKEEGQWRIMDREGNYILPLGYDSIKVAALDRLAVKLGDKWAFTWKGYGNPSRWYQTAYTFEDVRFGYDCRCVKRNGKWAIVDEEIEPNKLTDYLFDDVLGSLWEDPVPLKRDGKWGLYDCKKKEFVTEFLYDEILNIDIFEITVIVDGVEKTIPY